MRRWPAFLLPAAALAGSTYLLLRGLALLAGNAGTDVCSTVFARGCDATLSHPSSQRLGIPLAGWGVIHAASLLLLLGLGRVLDDGFRVAANAAATALAAVGALVGVVLLASILLGDAPFCPLCAAVNLVNVAAVVPIARANGLPLRDQLAAFGRGFRWLLGAKAKDPLAMRWRVLGFSFVAVVGLAIYQWILVEVDRHRAAGREFDPAKVLARFEEAERKEIPVEAWNPVLGPATAKARLVVFSDAFCPHCRSFWQAAPKLAKRYGDDLQIVFKHFPLDPPCNRAARQAMHPWACAAAASLEAARRQDAFWVLHDALLSHAPPRDPKAIPRLVEEAGFDAATFKTEADAPATRAAIDADVALGARLGVVATPALFLDGRPIETPSPAAVTLLLDHVLGRDAKSPR